MSNSLTNTEKKKALAPKLRFSVFKEDLLTTTFGRVVESNLYGPRFNADDYNDEGNVKTIRGTDLGRDGEIKYHQVPLARLDENTVLNHKLKDGDIVMITTADCGATGVFRKQDIDYLSSAYGVRIRLNELGYPYYFKYFFQTRLAKKEINSFIRKATVANLPGSDILRIRLYLPTLPEQQKIASFLSAIDEKIQQLTRKKELLEQYKKGVMQQLFSGKLRFKAENGKAYPKWEETGLGEHIDLISGFAFKGLDISEKPGGIPLMRGINITEGYVRHSEDIDRYFHGDVSNLENFRLKEGDLVLGMDGSKVGKNSALISKIDEGSLLVQRVACIRSLDTSDVNFIYQHIRSPQFIKYVDMVNTSSGIPHISSKQIRDFKILFPIKEEQQKIASFLSGIDTKIESVANQIKHTQTFKKGLLQQMFV